MGSLKLNMILMIKVVCDGSHLCNSVSRKDYRVNQCWGLDILFEWCSRVKLWFNPNTNEST